MIGDTKAECKILKTEISETTATITLLIFALKSTPDAQSFQFFVADYIDSDTKYTQINKNIYWVDRQTTNYSYDSINVDTNKYKEIVLTLDLTQGDTKLVGNRWCRSCYLLLKDTKETDFRKPAWLSPKLTLISDEFETPSITNIRMGCDESKHIEVTFDLNYVSEKDFNYNNSNFKISMLIRNVSTDTILENIQQASLTTSLNDNKITTTLSYEYDVPVVVQLLITNANYEKLYEVRKIFRPFKKYSDTYILTNEGIKGVLNFFVVTEEDHTDD